LLRDGVANVPAARNMLALRKLDSGEPNPAYLYLFQHFIPFVVGVNKYKREAKGSIISAVVTPSDEAFAILLIENSETRWTDEFDKKQKGGELDGATITPSKYTAGGCNRKQKGYTRKYRGWNLEGIKRYNVVLDMVREDRKKNQKWFDEVWDKHARQINSLSCKNGSDDENDKDSDSWIEAGNDLFDDELDNDDDEDSVSFEEESSSDNNEGDEDSAE